MILMPDVLSEWLFTHFFREIYFQQLRDRLCRHVVGTLHIQFVDISLLDVTSVLLSTVCIRKHKDSGEMQCCF